MRILDYVKNADERLWYAQTAIENGRRRNVIVLQIESGLYRSQGKALVNVQRTLSAAQSGLAATSCGTLTTSIS